MHAACIHTYVYIHIYICIYMYVYIYIYIYIYIIYICRYLLTSTHTHTSYHVHVYMCIYIYIYIYISIHICRYTHTGMYERMNEHEHSLHIVHIPQSLRLRLEVGKVGVCCLRNGDEPGRALKAKPLSQDYVLSQHGHGGPPLCTFRQTLNPKS